MILKSTRLQEYRVKVKYLKRGNRFYTLTLNCKREFGNTNSAIGMRL